MTHVLIIGAGLIGACLAFRLTRAGARVTVIEAARPATGASGASFGWINASFFHSTAHFNLRAEGTLAHHRLDRDLCDTGTLWQGCLWWEEEGAAYDARAKALVDLGYALHHLTRAEIEAREPALAAPPRALYFPGEGAVDAARLTERLLAASGATVWTGCPVHAIVTTSGRVMGVRTAAGAVCADHVILAAGTGSATLLAALGLTLPMLRRPGMILRTWPVTTRLNHILAGPAQELRQDPDGSLIAPLSAAHQGDATEVVTTLPPALADAALARIRALLPGTAPMLARISLAHRPVPADGLPALGATGIPGLSLAVMHSGVTLAPLVAELLTAEVMEEVTSPLLDDFRPERFQH